MRDGLCQADLSRVRLAKSETTVARTRKLKLKPLQMRVSTLPAAYTRPNGGKDPNETCRHALWRLRLATPAKMNRALLAFTELELDEHARLARVGWIKPRLIALSSLQA